MPENYVPFYAEGNLTMRVYFPNGKIDCKHCQFLRERSLRGICQCSLTHDFVDHQDLNGRLATCPITIKEEQ